MMRTFLALILWTAGTSFARSAQVWETGSSKSLLEPGSSASRVKTLAPGGLGGSGPGKVMHGVNLYTGQPSYSVPLGAITARSVTFPLVLSYSGNTKAQLEPYLEKSPTSWVGLGWNLSVPYVATNHKGTFTTADDAIFCSLGPYGGGQILTDSAGTRYIVSSNPHIKVAFDTAASGEYQGQFTRWVFTFPDGKKMLFGQDTNAQRYVLRTGSLIKASPFAGASKMKKFIYRWDLRTYYDTIPNRPPRNALTFEYERFLESAGTGKNYVREAHVRNIKWMENGLEVERYEFLTASKNYSSIYANTQYVGYASTEPRDDQKLFETRRLDSLKCYKEGVLDHLLKFDMSNHGRMLLDSIKIFRPKPNSQALHRDSGWTFTYDPARFYLLTGVTSPTSAKQTYAYSIFDFTGTEGAQSETGTIMRRAKTGSEIQLPTDNVKLQDWSVENTCDERFCYTVVRDSDTEALPGDTAANGVAYTNKLYVEIKRNLGSYFDHREHDSLSATPDPVAARFEIGDPWTDAESWRFMPMGDYVLLVGEAMGQVQMYAFDGVRWNAESPFSGDPNWNGNSFGGRIKIHPTPNYIVVHKPGPPSKVSVTFRKPAGWSPLNKNPNNCDLDNKTEYGASVRPAGSISCLEWQSEYLMVSAMKNWFFVIDVPSDVFSIYAIDSSGVGFKEISNKFPTLTPHPWISIQPDSSKKMNLGRDVCAISSSDNYFLMSTGTTELQGIPVESIHAVYFDGDSLYETMSSHQPVSTVFPTCTHRLYASQNYFLLWDYWQSGTIKYYFKKFHQGILSFARGNDPITNLDRSKINLIKTFRDMFTVEVFKNESAVGLRPAWDAATGRYSSYLFQISPEWHAWVDQSSAMVKDNLNLFGVSPSSSDEVLIGARASNGANRCAEDADAGSCTLEYYSLRVNPERTPSNLYLPATGWAPIYSTQAWKPLKQAQSAFSNAARMGAWTVLDSSGSAHRIRSRYYQYDGKGYSLPESISVVSQVTLHSSLDTLNRNKVTYQFNYRPSPSAKVEFNSHLQLPQFEMVDVKQVSGASNLGTARTTFNFDGWSSPLTGKATSLIGSEKAFWTLAANGDTLSASSAITKPYRSPSWPLNMFIPRTSASVSRFFAPNKGRMSDTTYFFNYNDTNGMPRFVLRNNRPGKILLSQTLFDGMGFPKQTVQYRLASQPDTNALKTWNPSLLFSNSSAIASSKQVFDGYYLREDSVWREHDQALTDAQLRAGTAPTFRLDEGWLPNTRITGRDTGHAYEVIESKVVLNKLAGPLGETYVSSFFEGRRGDPVAVVRNSKLSNCAVLLAENGNAGISGLDFQGRWESPATTYSTVQACTGRYSLKVVDGYGPTINLYLKDVRTLGQGFKASAWIYADTATPQFVMERRRANGQVVSSLYGQVAGGMPFKKRVWQRWDLNLSVAQVTDGDLFISGNDYLRIRVGTGAPSGNGNKVLYVDDMVYMPSNATFSTQAFDHRGILTSVTDAAHRTQHQEIGFRGNILLTKDHELRTFGQSAGHRMGEN